MEVPLPPHSSPPLRKVTLCRGVEKYAGPRLFKDKLYNCLLLRLGLPLKKLPDLIRRQMKQVVTT